MRMTPMTAVEREAFPSPPTYPVSYQPSEDSIFMGIRAAAMSSPTNSSLSAPPPPQMGTMEDVQTQYSPGWSTGLCDCFSDMHTCCLGFWCPCIAFGRIAEIVDKGASSCCHCGSLYLLLLCVSGGSIGAAHALGHFSGLFILPTCQWILSCVYRGKLRQSLNMRRSTCADCCIHFWCEACALCQEYRELQSRGYDLSLGWEGNNRNTNRPTATSTEPPAALSMDRWS